MDSEVWRPIPDHDGYEASSLGRLRSKRKVLATHLCPDGYLRTHLGARYQNTVHAIVALAFLGPKPRGMCVAHKNAVKSDNRPDNLQYTTFVGNMLHCRGEGSDPCPLLKSENGKQRVDRRGPSFQKRGEQHGMATRTEAQARRVHRLLAKGMLRSEIAEKLDVPYLWVAGVASGRRWRHIHPDLSMRR